MWAVRFGADTEVWYQSIDMNLSELEDGGRHLVRIWRKQGGLARCKAGKAKKASR